jgi:hypothetical protein
MSDTDLAARLDAVERAITDDGTDLADARDDADLAAAVADLESRVADLEATVEELDAGLQAVRGYAGNLRAVNRDVERRASAALAKAETLESSVERGTADAPENGHRSDGPLSVDGTVRDRHRDGTDRDHRDGTDRNHQGGTDRDHHPGTEQDAGRRAAAPSGDDRGPRKSRRERERTNGRSAAETGRPSRSDGTAAQSNDPTRTGTEDDGSGGDSQTEQFIERVRDAL